MDHSYEVSFYKDGNWEEAGQISSSAAFEVCYTQTKTVAARAKQVKDRTYHGIADLVLDVDDKLRTTQRINRDINVNGDIDMTLTKTIASIAAAASLLSSGAANAIHPDALRTMQIAEQWKAQHQANAIAAHRRAVRSYNDDYGTGRGQPLPPAMQEASDRLIQDFLRDQQ